MIEAPIDKTFYLFGPIAEKEWADGWNPQIVYQNNENIEEHMIFMTDSPHGHAESKYTWIVSKYCKDQYLIEYFVYTQERMWWIQVQCLKLDDGKTEAEITYTYNGLTQKGNTINEWAMGTMFSSDLKDWENEINHYLRTGKRIKHNQIKQG